MRYDKRKWASVNQKVNGGEEKARTDEKVVSASEDKATYLVQE